MTFDVAITCYRRPELVRQAVLSCLSQGPALQQVIVVDDASGDETAQVIQKLGDARIRFVQRQANGGIATARRDAFALSTADWTVSLDSDHELLPGALDRLDAFARTLDGSVDILGARFQWDNGTVTPKVLPPGKIGYRERIIYSARKDSIGSDYLCAVSRRLRELVKWVGLRTGLPDTLFHLDLAQVGDAIFLPDELALEKTAGGHSWTRGSSAQRWARRRLDAADGVKALRCILERHQEGLARWAPDMLADLYLQGAFFALLSEQRATARAWLRESVRGGRGSVGKWGMLALTFLPIGIIAAAYRIRR